MWLPLSIQKALVEPSDGSATLPLFCLIAVMVAKGPMLTEPTMSVPRTVADVIRQHVTLDVECIDRMYLNVYQPKLQHEQGAAYFFRYHRGHSMASTALMEPMTTAFVHAVESFVAQNAIPYFCFAKKQRKDDVAAEYR